MANVYSTVFLRNSTTIEIQTDPVPPGFVWILRDLDITGPGLDASALNVAIVTTQLIYVAGAAPPDPPNFPWRGRQVLEEGEYVAFTPLGTTATWSIHASGYVLTLP